MCDAVSLAAADEKCGFTGQDLADFIVGELKRIEEAQNKNNKNKRKKKDKNERNKNEKTE